MDASADLPLTRLHARAALLDLTGLALTLAEALLFVPGPQADRRIMLLVLAVVPVAFLLFAVLPRRVQFLAETTVPRRSLMVYASLGLPVALTLLSLALVAASGSYDSFAGFSLVLAADGGRNLWEWLSLALRARR